MSTILAATPEHDRWTEGPVCQGVGVPNWLPAIFQGSTRAQERAAREKERQQLADLVGRNLTYVSQLDGLDFERYSGVVLPRVLEQVTHMTSSREITIRNH